MRREGYGTWSVHLCVCVSVCLSLYLYSRTTGNEAACERYTRLQRNKCSDNNVANLAKTAGFWQEKPVLPWTSFRDPTHQLARCSCVFITRLGPCSTVSAPGVVSRARPSGEPHYIRPARLPLEQHSCVAVNAIISAASLFRNHCIHYQGM